MEAPIIDLQSDHYFMGEALRQAARAYEAEEAPIGAVIVPMQNQRSGLRPRTFRTTLLPKQALFRYYEVSSWYLPFKP